MEHLMLDLETLGTKSYSAILSIGAVFFDIETGETGDSIELFVDLQSCIRNGLEIDIDTLKWWIGQDKIAKDKLFNSDSFSLAEALADFSSFIYFNCSDDDVKVWGNSASFDCGLLSNAYHKLDMDIPWKFWNERDVRTLVSFYPEIKSNMEFVGTKHSAIDDCKHQIKYCSAIWNKLKNKV